MNVTDMATIRKGGEIKMAKNKKQVPKEQKKQDKKSGNPKVDGPNFPAT